ncbi:MAG: N-acetylmuramoyl-L-alanine amidase [Firmicutes bacterium]|nr:N-acetylmuramoyl-L-alanine amidase [Bacillota bacterium]
MQTGRLIPLAKSLVAVPVTVLGLSLMLAVSPSPAAAVDTLTAPTTTAPAASLSIPTPTYTSTPQTPAAAAALKPVSAQPSGSTAPPAASNAAPASGSSTAAPAGATPPAPPKELIMPNCPGVNLRSGPDVKNEILIEIDLSDTVPVLEEKGDWYKVEYKGVTGWVAGWVVTKCSASLAGKLIVIDPGHGGVDSGAVGRTGLKEKEVNLDIAQRLGKLLREQGARVVLTRETDVFIPLYDRPALANRLHADLFLSVHADSTSKSDINGTSTYYYRSPEPSRQGIFDRSITLAKDVQKSLISGLSITDRGVKKSPGIGFAVLRESLMPSILVETAFLSNSSDEAKLKSPDFRQSTAVFIARGLTDYFKSLASPVRF